MTLDKEMLRETLGFLRHYDLLKKNMKLYEEALEEENKEAPYKLSKLIAEHMGIKEQKIYPYWLKVAAEREHPEALYQYVCYLVRNQRENEAYPFALKAQDEEALSLNARHYMAEIALAYQMHHPEEDEAPSALSMRLAAFKEKYGPSKLYLYLLTYLLWKEGKKEEAKESFLSYKKHLSPKDHLYPEEDPDGLEAHLS